MRQRKNVKGPGKYTIRYSARDGALDVVTISGVIKDAVPGTKPLYIHTRSYTDAIDNDSITAINWPEYKLVGVQVNGTDKPLDKDVDGKTTSSITITDIHGKDSGKEYTPTAPAVDGHDTAGSSLQDGKFTPTGKNDVIIFYYTKSSGNVTYKAVDGEGNTLWTGSGKVTKGAVPTEVNHISRRSSSELPPCGRTGACPRSSLSGSQSAVDRLEKKLNLHQESFTSFILKQFS